MLSRFTVSNYRNFDKETCLDLTDVYGYDFNTDCIMNGILNKAVILGRNGSGKTNLGLALFDISITLTDNLQHPLQTDESTFLNGDSSSGYASFIYEFRMGDIPLYYEYRKTAPRDIVYELLRVGTDTVFVRDGIKGTSDYSGLSRYGAGTLNITIGNGPLSVLRFAYRNTSQSEDSPIAFIIDFVSRMLYFGTALGGIRCIGLKNAVENPEAFLMRNGLVAEFQDFLKEMAGVDVRLQGKQIPGMQDVLVQEFDNCVMPFSSISSPGTKAVMQFYYWCRHFEEVSFLYVDGLDAYCHYMLLENILRIIIGNGGFQSILTTQNTDLVDNNLLRPDCYLIIAGNGIHSMPKLTEREICEGHNLRKLLRGGEFDT